jgi:hypothetical protein
MNERPPPPRLWHVFATYFAAVVAIFVTTGVAIETLRALYPDVPEETLLRSLPGLLGGSLAASAGLVLTILLAVRPLEPARLRLLPGWESGLALAIMALGLLALGQTLDSLTALAGLADRGSLALIRRLLESAAGPDLFGAVIVLGPVAGAAEEIFFRGYMQTRLRERWPAPVAIVVASLAFAALHVDVSSVHALLAFALGCYLGFVVEATGSVLPAIVCHVVNNIVYTLQTSLGATLAGRDANTFAVVVGSVVFVLCVRWIRRAAAGP